MNYRCSRCQNTEHPSDSKFCKICGLKISRLVAAGTTTKIGVTGKRIDPKEFREILNNAPVFPISEAVAKEIN